MHLSDLSQAMSAAACFMISGMCVSGKILFFYVLLIWLLF